MCQFGEEDFSVKGAGVIVALRKRVQPPVSAIMAQMVFARQPLGGFHSAVVRPIAQVVVWLGTNRAVALVVRNVLNVDVWAGNDEGQGRRRCCQQVCVLIISRDVAFGLRVPCVEFCSKFCQRA